jgi:hypothetical protein
VEAPAVKDPVVNDVLAYTNPGKWPRRYDSYEASSSVENAAAQAAQHSENPRKDLDPSVSASTKDGEMKFSPTDNKTTCVKSLEKSNDSELPSNVTYNYHESIVKDSSAYNSGSNTYNKLLRCTRELNEIDPIIITKYLKENLKDLSLDNVMVVSDNDYLNSK